MSRAKPSDCIKQMNVNEICKFLETSKGIPAGQAGQIRNSIDIFLENHKEAKDVGGKI